MTGWPGHRFALVLGGGILAMWVVAMVVAMRLAALAPDAAGPLIAVFEPGTAREEIFARIAKAGGEPIRTSSFPFIWVVAGESPGLAGRLAAQGAMGSYRELPIPTAIAGCFALADATVASALRAGS